MTETKMKADLRIYKVDVSRNCSPELLIAGKVYDVYLFDANRHVHCCEVTPSYEMHFLYSTTENYLEDDEAREKLDTDLMEADLYTGPVSYFHVRTIPLSKSIPVATYDEEEWEDYKDNGGYDSDEEAYNELIEHYIEHCNANHYA